MRKEKNLLQFLFSLLHPREREVGPLVLSGLVWCCVCGGHRPGVPSEVKELIFKFYLISNNLNLYDCHTGQHKSR